MNLRSEEEQRTTALFASRRTDPQARDELVELFLPLARYLANCYRGKGEPVDDLVQVASIGLIKAVDRFDPKKGFKFQTFASATIIGEIKRHFRDKGWALRVPRRLQENILRVNKVINELTQATGKSPAIPEIGKKAGLTQEEVLEAIDGSHAYSTIQLDAPNDQGHSLMDKYGAEDAEIEMFEKWESVAPALKRLPERERYLLYLRFFKGESQGQIAAKLGMSQMQVSRTLSRILAKLRQKVGALG